MPTKRSPHGGNAGMLLIAVAMCGPGWCASPPQSAKVAARAAAWVAAGDTAAWAARIATTAPRIIIVVRLRHPADQFHTSRGRVPCDRYKPLRNRLHAAPNPHLSLRRKDEAPQRSGRTCPDVAELPSENVPRPIPFQHVVMPAGAAEQDYVVAVFDIRQLQDRETPITFEFSGLPNRRHPTAAFNPIFSPAKIRPYVARVLLTEADRDGVMRQRVCPVSGRCSAAEGPIIKLYIADYPLYLSGEECIAAVNESPEKYLPHPFAHPRPRSLELYHWAKVAFEQCPGKDITCGLSRRKRRRWHKARRP